LRGSTIRAVSFVNARVWPRLVITPVGSYLLLLVLMSDCVSNRRVRGRSSSRARPSKRRPWIRERVEKERVFADTSVMCLISVV
jgi:uncharacterized membrane protein